LEPVDTAGPPRQKTSAVALTLLGQLVYFGATLCGAVALVMLLLALAPGDPIDLLPNADEVRPELEARWHLDRPLPVRYALYLGQLATGDLGTSLSYRPGTPVWEVIARPAMRSAGWLVSAWMLTLIWGSGLAWFTAGRTSVATLLVRVLSIAPVFLIAHLAVSGFNTAAWSLMEAGTIDRPGWFALPDQPSSLRTALAVVILAVGSGALAELHAEVENALVALRRSGFVDAARARGMPVWPHVAWNLVSPLTTIAVSRVAFFVGGLVILEKVLLLNGVGAILWRAALLRDYDLCLGIALLAAVVVAGARLTGDGIRITTDPRLRTAR